MAIIVYLSISYASIMPIYMLIFNYWYMDWCVTEPFQYHLCSVYAKRIVMAGGGLVVIGQWQSSGSSSQGVQGLNSL